MEGEAYFLLSLQSVEILPFRRIELDYPSILVFIQPFFMDFMEKALEIIVGLLMKPQDSMKNFSIGRRMGLNKKIK